MALLAHKAAGALTGATTAALDSTGAKIIVIGLSVFSAATITDSMSNTWTPRTLTTDAGSMFVRIFYCMNPTTSASHTFTVGVPGGNAPAIVVGVFSDNVTVYDTESAGGTVASGTTVQPGSLTPATTGELLVIVTGSESTITVAVNNSFSAVDAAAFLSGNNYGCDMHFLIDGASSAINPTATLSGSATGACVMAAFKSTSAAAPLRRSASSLNGLGTPGPFFTDPLAAYHHEKRRDFLSLAGSRYAM